MPVPFAYPIPRSPLSSLSGSQSLSSSSSPEVSRQDGETTSEAKYFGSHVRDSPLGFESEEEEGPTDSDTEEDDAYSDSTCEDDERLAGFGHPLERMPRVQSADCDTHHVIELVKTSVDSATSSRSGSVNSMTSTIDYDDIDYDELVDHLLDEKRDPLLSFDQRNMVTLTLPPNSKLQNWAESLLPIMVKRLLRSSPDLLLMLEANHPDFRDDPWNPVPHILCGIERGQYVYLCMQGLFEYNHPPLMTVGHHIDLFRQILEGLSFLHEHHIAGLSCAERSSYMVDLSSAPRTPPLGSISPPPFDRSVYPVRYYFVNFSRAVLIPKEYMPRSPISAGGNSRVPNSSLFRKDVQDCGALFDQLLAEVPQISQKFRSLIKAMTLGGFTADDSRRLFEALCRSLESPVFESKVPLRSTLNVIERSQTLSHPLASSVTQPLGRPSLERVNSH